MVDFTKHSLKNFTQGDIDGWMARGMGVVAGKMGINVSELSRMINQQEFELAERKKHPTIADTSVSRQALREKILADYLDLYPYAERGRKAVIVLGQIASGKSSYCKVLENGGLNAIVDVDFIKQGHGNMAALRADFDGGKGSDMVHEEASMLSKQVLDLMSNEGYNLVIPKTGIEFKSIDNIARKLKVKGYEVLLCYIDLPIQKCVERNYYRFIDEMQRGIPSRLIPFSTIEAIDDKPFKTFSRFLASNSPYIDAYAAFSNDVEPGEDMFPIDLGEILLYNKEHEEEEKNDD